MTKGDCRHPGKPLTGPHQPPPHVLPVSAPGWQDRSAQDSFDALFQIFGYHLASYPLAGKQRAALATGDVRRALSAPENAG